MRVVMPTIPVGPPRREEIVAVWLVTTGGNAVDYDSLEGALAAVYGVDEHWLRNRLMAVFLAPDAEKAPGS